MRLWFLVTEMPAPYTFCTTRPEITLKLVWMLSRVDLLVPSMTMVGVAGVVAVAGLAPGPVYPAMISGSVIAGRLLDGVITTGPGPDSRNAIESIPGFPLAWTIASRRVPPPVSPVLVTQ